MPNFVKVDSKPFHPDTYIGPEHEEDFSGGTHERDMGIKLRVENTVRWRWAKGKDGQDVGPLVPFSLLYHSLTCAHWYSVANRMLMLFDGQMVL
jgi:Leo1-like protein